MIVHNEFQPNGQTWEERATLDGLNSVLDPSNISIKNNLIDIIHKAAIQNVLKGKKIDNILDFGCGTGRLANLLANFGNNYYGIDITPEMVSAAKKYISQPRRHFFCFDGKTIPVEINNMDIIVSVLLLQHFKKVSDLKDIAKEFLRVSSNNGICVYIEQVGKKRDEKKFIDAFNEAGFTLCELKTVRRGRSISSWLASKINNQESTKWITVLKMLNNIEVNFPPLTETYEEKIFVFKRIDKYCLK